MNIIVLGPHNNMNQTNIFFGRTRRAQAAAYDARAA